MDSISRDLRQAIRELWRDPMFTLIVVLSIGLGVGANTTVFSWLDNIVQRPFPGIPDGAQLLAINVADSDGRVEGMPPIAYRTLEDWVSRVDVFDAVAAHTQVRLNLRTAPSADGEPIWTEITSANFFPALGIGPWRGRFYADSDSSARAAVVVISHAFWQRRFGGASDLIGRAVLFNGVPLTVIGIAPPRFAGVVTGLAFDAWIPIWLQPPLIPGSDWMTDRGARRMQAVARLHSGVTRDQAQQALNVVASEVSRFLGETPVTGAGVRWISDTQLGSLMGPLGAAMMAVTLVVLMTACANVAGLLLARGVSRQREMAIQVAVGASRRHLLQPALLQACVLSVLGCAAGLWVAQLTKGALLAFVPRVSLPVGLEIDINARVVMFAAAAAAGAALLFALVPALRASQPDVVEALKASRSAGGRAGRLRHALVVSQIAFSLMSLATAGLFLRSVASASAVPLGFSDPGRVLLVSTDLAFTRLAGPALTTLVDQALERVRGLPGATHAAAASFVPLSFGGPPGLTTKVEGYVPGPQERMFVASASVSSGYFETMGIPVIEGRAVTVEDRADSRQVAVVNQAFVTRYWSGQSALGFRVDQGDGWAVIVGVAGDSAIDSLTDAPQPIVYHPLAQRPVNALTLFVRGAGENPLTLVEPVRRSLASAHPDLPALDPGTLADHMQAAVFVQTIGANAFSVFGVVAVLIAAVGMYGVVAQQVAERRRDIAIAVSLGAPMSSIAAAVARPALRLTSLGVAVGVALAVIAATLVRSQLIGISALDPMSIAGSVAVVGVTAVFSCAWPTWRATRTDPVSVVRTQ